VSRTQLPVSVVWMAETTKHHGLEWDGSYSGGVDTKVRRNHWADMRAVHHLFPQSEYTLSQAGYTAQGLLLWQSGKIVRTFLNIHSPSPTLCTTKGAQ
jgi:hypothetical protein